jgi:flavorubredoxin
MARDVYPCKASSTQTIAKEPTVKAVVVYESLFGNTHEVAEAVAEGLRDAAEVDVASVKDSSPELVRGADLLVVGGPTHAHGMASTLTRKGAMDDSKKKGKPVPDIEGPALREWFDALGTTEGRAAAFDTRLPPPKLVTGSAARGIAKRLRRHGYDVIGEESFVVDHSEGPPSEGELDRAREWGRTLVAG